MRVPRVFSSTTAQIALAFLITQIVAVGMALVLMHGFTQRTILSDAKHFVRELDADVGDEFRRGGARAATIAIEERLRQSGPRDAVIALRAPDGSIAVGNLDRWPAGLGGDVQWRETRLSVTGSGGPAAIGLHTSRLSGGYQLLTGQTLEGESRLREISRNAFVISSIVGIVFAVLGWWSARMAPVAGGRNNDRLAPCPSQPHCVCSDTGTNKDTEHWVEPIGLGEVLAGSGASVVSQDAGYLHATYTSGLFRFVDDLELRLDGPQLQLRSSSRVGYSDLGANRKRVEDLRMRLTAAFKDVKS